MKPNRVVDGNGTIIWRVESMLHREDGPAVEYADGSKYWYLHGKLHREDGPAVEYASGTKFWWLNGKQHRVDGPSSVFSEPHDYQDEWYIQDIPLTKKEIRIAKKLLSGDLHLAPLYINHPTLKYICQFVLSGGPK